MTAATPRMNDAATTADEARLYLSLFLFRQKGERRVKASKVLSWGAINWSVQQIAEWTVERVGAANCPINDDRRYVEKYRCYSITRILCLLWGQLDDFWLLL